MAESLICNKKAYPDLRQECDSCPHFNDCVVKGLKVAVARADLPKENIAQPFQQPFLESAAQPLLVPHDYRNIKVAEGVTMTIDIEDIKREMEKALYESMGLPSRLIYGA